MGEQNPSGQLYKIFPTPFTRKQLNPQANKKKTLLKLGSGLALESFGLESKCFQRQE